MLTQSQYGGLSLCSIWLQPFSVSGVSELSDNALTHLVVMIAPYLPPTNGVGDTPPLPYYLYVILVEPMSYVWTERHC